MEGLHIIDFLYKQHVHIDVLVTDRHKSINKWLRETHPSVTHYFDTWHVAKGTSLTLFVLICKYRITQATRKLSKTDGM